MVELKVGGREAQMPRNLVTNSITSLQRKVFMEKTLFLQRNIKNELRDNADKIQRKLDSIYFEDNDKLLQTSPIFKMKLAAAKTGNGNSTPQQKLSKLFGNLGNKNPNATKTNSDFEDMIN